MLRVMAFAGASNVLLDVLEAFVPSTRAFLPLGGDDLVQSSGIFMGSLAVWILWKCIAGRSLSERNETDDDQEVML